MVSPTPITVRQLELADVHRSSLLLVMEPSHIHWMQRRLPEALPIACSLKRAVQQLPMVSGSTLDERSPHSTWSPMSSNHGRKSSTRVPESNRYSMRASTNSAG